MIGSAAGIAAQTGPGEPNPSGEQLRRGGEWEETFLSLVGASSAPTVRDGAQDRPAGTGRVGDRARKAQGSTGIEQQVLPTATTVAAAELVSPAPLKPAVALAAEERVAAGEASEAQRPAPAEPRAGETAHPERATREARPSPATAPVQNAQSPVAPAAAAQAGASAAPAPVREPAGARRESAGGAQGSVAAGKQPAAAAGAVSASGGNAAAGQRGSGEARGDAGGGAPGRGQGSVPNGARALGMLERAAGAQALRRGGTAGAQRGPLAAERDPGAFEAQLGRGLAAALRQGGGTVTMRLQPEALGDMKIKMDLEPGRVAARFEVATDQARELLDKSMDTLRSALEARGLDVERLEIRVADRAMDGAGATTGEHEKPSGFGGAGGDGGQARAGSEHPAQAGGMAGMPPGSPGSEEPPDPGSGPIVESRIDAGGARVWIRLDAVA